MTKFLFLIICAVLVSAEQVFGLGTTAQTASLGLLAFGPLLSPDPGDPSGGGRGTIGEKLAAAQGDVTRLTDRITTLESELATARQAGEAAVSAEVTRLTAALTEKETALTTAQAELATANTAKATAEAEVAKLTGEKQTVEERAQEMVASLGFPTSKLPGADDKGEANELPSSQAELETELAKLSTHKEKSALIRRYEEARAK